MKNFIYFQGGVEFGETIEEAAVRETFEETGVKVKIKNLFHVNEYISEDWNKRSVSMFFIAEVVEILEPTTKDGGKIKEIKWINLSELDNYDIKPRRISEMLKNPSNFEDKREMYSVDFKKIL